MKPNSQIVRPGISTKLKFRDPNFKPLLPPFQTSPFIFIFTLLLPEVQASETWKPLNNVMRALSPPPPNKRASSPSFSLSLCLSDLKEVNT
jgi:hypothetical protein